VPFDGGAEIGKPIFSPAPLGKLSKSSQATRFFHAGEPHVYRTSHHIMNATGSILNFTFTNFENGTVYENPGHLYLYL
jgi:hypothetical protein